jgi:hypothetical protein
MDAVISAPMTAAEMQQRNIDELWAEAAAQVADMQGLTKAQLVYAAAKAFPQYTRTIALQAYVSLALQDAASATNGRSEGTQTLSPMDEE